MGPFNVALLEALLSAGVSPERARAVVDLLDRSIDERVSLHTQVPTTRREIAELDDALSRDLAAMRDNLSRELADMNANLSRGIAEMYAHLSREIRGIDLRLAETRIDLLKWILGALAAQTALLLSAGRLF